MGIFKKLISNVSNEFKNALEESKEAVKANAEQVKNDVVANFGQMKQDFKTSIIQDVKTTNEALKKPKNYNVEVNGDVYVLQIIPLDDEYQDFINENKDDLDDIYQEFRDKADDEDLLVEFNFLSEEGEREMGITDEDGEDLDCDIDNYLNVYSYPEAVEYFKTHNEPVDDDYYDEYKKVIDGIKNIKCGEYGSKYIEKAIKKLVTKEENNFIEALIKGVVDEFGSDKKYLLIYGRRQESSTYSFELEDKTGNEYDEDSLMLFGSGTYSNGDIEMEVDSIADAIIYKDNYYGASDIDENHYIEEPVFQMVDSDLEPIDLDDLEDADEIVIEEEKNPVNDSSSQENIAVQTLNVDNMFSERLETLISVALQDGVLTEKEKGAILRRAEKEGEDVDEVEMILDARIAQIKAQNNQKGVETQNKNAKTPERSTADAVAVKSYSGISKYPNELKTAINMIASERILDKELNNKQKEKLLQIAAKFPEVDTYELLIDANAAKLENYYCRELGSSSIYKISAIEKNIMEAKLYCADNPKVMSAVAIAEHVLQTKKEKGES